MKNLNRKDIILIISYITLCVFFLFNFSDICKILVGIIKLFSPFIIGVLLAFILNVLVNFIERRLFGKVRGKKLWKKVERPISITISVVIVILVIAFVMNLLIPQLKNTVVMFTDILPDYKEDIVGILNRFDVGEDTIKTVSEYIDNFGKIITDYIKDNSEDVITVTTEVAASVINVVSTGVISIVFAIYMIAQKETLIKQVNKVMRAYLKPRTIEKITNISIMSNRTFSSFVTGQCLEAIIFGSLCFIGMLLFRLPYALTVAVLMGFTALIPVFGAFVGTILGAILIFMVSPVKAIVFVIFVLILQQIENNLIYPKVVGKSVGLPGMWVLLAVTIGAGVGGIIGMFVATPLCSVLYSLFSGLVNDRLKRNKIVINKVEEKTSNG